MDETPALGGDDYSLNAEQTQPIVSRGRFDVAWDDFRLIGLCSAALFLLIALERWLGFLLPLRLVLAVAYVLFVPGYCLTAALFPRNDDLDGIERLGLSLGLSIAWVAVLALFLDALPWGLRLWPIAFGELLSIGLFAGAALWRRARLPADAAYAPELSWQPRAWWRSLPRGEQRTCQFIGLALVLITLALAWTFLVPTPDQYMTEFYMLGKAGLAEDFPREVAVGQTISVTLGANNLERAAHTYRVEVWATDPWTAGRRQLAAQAGPFTLAVGQGREWPVAWQMPWAGGDQVVEILLFDGDNKTPYRQLRLWLNVTGSG
jgi:uncharacterized membrane protein